MPQKKKTSFRGYKAKKRVFYSSMLQNPANPPFYYYVLLSLLHVKLLVKEL